MIEETPPYPGVVYIAVGTDANGPIAKIGCCHTATDPLQRLRELRVRYPQVGLTLFAAWPGGHADEGELRCRFAADRVRILSIKGTPSREFFRATNDLLTLAMERDSWAAWGDASLRSTRNPAERYRRHRDKIKFYAEDHEYLEAIKARANERAERQKLQIAA